MLWRLLEFVKEKQWEKASVLAEEIKQTGEESADFLVLYASVCAATGEVKREYDSIVEGLSKYPFRYEFYSFLGNYYSKQQKSNQAYLCYEQALHYCQIKADRQIIQNNMAALCGGPAVPVSPVTVVILRTSDGWMPRELIDSIQGTMAGQYEILLIGNFCQQQRSEGVNSQHDIKMVACDETMGFAGRVNLGIKNAGIRNDIFLLSEDAVLLPNAFFWLRMALYERTTIGAAGGISNKGFHQQRIELSCNTMEEYWAAAEVLNVPDSCAYENRLWLDAFSLLLKRAALDETGLFEGRDIRHWYSCIDYGMKLMEANYESVLCYNSFIYRRDTIERYGELTFEKTDLDELENKWKFPVLYYCDIRAEMIQKICQPRDKEIFILEVGCGCGATLSAIQCQYPNAHVYGIELIEEVAAAGKYMADIVPGNIETMKLPFKTHMFDYIMFGDVLEHLRCPEKVIERMREYLSADGRILASIPNLMNIGVMVSLLKGNFTYQDKGILDQTHIHMFTLNEIKRMFHNAGYVIKDIQRNYRREELPDYEEEDQKIMEAVYQIKGIQDIQEFEVYQYLVEAAVSENVN